MLSYRMRTSRRDGLARRPLHEPSYARRKAYDPSKYDRDQSEDPLRNEFWPSTSNRAREGDLKKLQLL